MEDKKLLKKRKFQLFEKFSKQLLLLKSNGLIDNEFKYEKPYLCPLCLDEFSEEHLTPSSEYNYLTEEDAPPAALSGSRIALTCKKCNSECGHNIDFHLIEALMENDSSKFLIGTKLTGKVEFEGSQLGTEIISNDDGTLSAYHDEKRNNPTLLKKFIESVKNAVKKGEILLYPKKTRVDPMKVNHALNKTNYIITFSKFGYIFLLNSFYDSFRAQLLKPDEKIFHWNLSIKKDFHKDQVGTHYILNDNIKAIFNIYELKTKYSNTRIGSFLPIPNISFENYIKNMISNGSIFNKSVYDENVDLFDNIEDIIHFKKWLDK